MFESVKELIVEFLLSNSDVNNQTNYNTAHLIAKLGLSDQISYTDQGQAHEKIINTALHTLKEQYKLTKKQISLLMKIICDIRPSIVQDVCLESPEQLYEKKETMIHQENPHYNKCYKPSTKVVIKKIYDEIKAGEWDSFIKTSVKDLG